MGEKKTWCHKRDSEGNLCRVEFTDDSPREREESYYERVNRRAKELRDKVW
jgi:hypothetical protein